MLIEKFILLCNWWQWLRNMTYVHILECSHSFYKRGVSYWFTCYSKQLTNGRGFKSHEFQFLITVSCYCCICSLFSKYLLGKFISLFKPETTYITGFDLRQNRQARPWLTFANTLGSLDSEWFAIQDPKTPNLDREQKIVNGYLHSQFSVHYPSTVCYQCTQLKAKLE